MSVLKPSSTFTDLDFEEFSVVDYNGTRPSFKILDKLVDYLDDEYNVCGVDEKSVWLVVWCRKAVPPPSERPFMIAGLIAVWLVWGTDIPDMHLGIVFNYSEPRWMFLENDLLDDLQPFQIPKAKTLSAIMDQYFPEALAISYINHQLVVELKKTCHAQFCKRLESLPTDIEETDVALRYRNGPLHDLEPEPLEKPNPASSDGQHDYTDDVKSSEYFSPSAMLDKPFSNRSLHLNGAASSLLHSDGLVKVGETFWLDSLVTGPQRLTSNGKRVIKVDKRGKDFFSSLAPEPETYVGLVQGIFATQVPEIMRQPKIREGLRGAAIIRARKDLPPKSTGGIGAPGGVGSTGEIGAQGETPTSHDDAPPGQGSSPRSSTSQERAPPGKGPGTPVVDSITPLIRQVTPGETTGEVAGFVHWPEIETLYRDGRVLCFADVADILIEDGWEVMSTPKKRKAGVAGLDDDDKSPNPSLSNKRFRSEGDEEVSELEKTHKINYST